MVDASSEVEIPPVSRFVFHPWQCVAGAVIYRVAANIALWSLLHSQVGRANPLILICGLPTLLTVLGLHLVSRWGKRIGALHALLGIWVTAPLFTAIVYVSSASSPSLAVFLGFFVFGTVFFPIATFIFSTYDATLGALMLTTITLLLLGHKSLPLAWDFVGFVRRYPWGD